MDASTQIIISLTTTPPRFKFVAKTLSHLLNQNKPADKVELYIPKHYQRFPNHSFYLPQVPDGVSVQVIENDYGPATKVLPCARKYRGTNTRILYYDDDHNYPNYWNRLLVEETKKRPNDCLTIVGNQVEQYGFTQKQPRLTPRAKLHHRLGLKGIPNNLIFWFWRYAVQICNFTSKKPSQHFQPGYVDIAAGYGGVSVSPDFFIDDDYEIPSKLKPHDDVWLSGRMRINEIGIWQIGFFRNPRIGEFLFADNPNENASINPLYWALFNGLDRKNLNLFCIEYFRRNHGIWC